MSLADRWITLFNKPIPNVILRLVVLFGGFLSMAMSIALMRTTGLGNSPISCIPATLSYLVPLTPWHYYLHHEHLLFDCAGNSASP